MDNAPGFTALRNDKVLSSLNISLDFGRVKNKNHNPTIDKSVQEIEQEIKFLCPNGGPLNPGLLATAINNSNNRIRSNGISSKEILLKRDSYTGAPIEFEDSWLKDYKHEKRLQNHVYSEFSKSSGIHNAETGQFSVGQLVHVKTEGSKHSVRDTYLIMSIAQNTKEAIIQKLSNNQLGRIRYRVNLQEIYHAVPLIHQLTNSDDGGESDEEDGISLSKKSRLPDHLSRTEVKDSCLRRSNRTRKKPDYLSTPEIERTEH